MVERILDGSENKPLPNNLDDAIEQLEEDMVTNLRQVEASTPDPLAPLGERIAHTLAAARVRAEAEVVEELYKAKEGLE